MSVAKWVLDEVFPNYMSGLYLEIIKNSINNKLIGFKPFLDKGWTIRQNYILPNQNTNNKNTNNKNTKSITNQKFNNPRSFSKFISNIAQNDIIHCFVSHTSHIYKLFNSLDLEKYRFGVLILKNPKDTTEKYELFSTRQYLENNYYKLQNTIDNYDCYVSIIGYPPFYLGQSIFNNYRITGTFKSGCGSNSVFMIRDSKQKRFVLKFVNSDLSFDREVNALKITKDFIHSPNLIYYDKSLLYIITEWSGKDLKNIDNKLKNKYKEIIQNIWDTLYDQYNIYHNDIRWKNITYDGKRLILIDWGTSEKNNREQDHDNILRKDQIGKKD